MAGITLTVVGSAIGGPFGAAVGAALGGWIDAKTNYLGLGPKQEPSGRMSSLVQSASEGSPVNYCLGPENRLTGTIIWGSDLLESTSEEDVGGKGGGPQGQEKYVYHVHLAIAICEGEIQSVEKIWADGKLVYDGDPNVDITSNQISIEKTTLVIEAGLGVETKQVMTINSPSGGPDLLSVSVVMMW